MQQVSFASALGHLFTPHQEYISTLCVLALRTYLACTNPYAHGIMAWADITQSR